MFTTYPISCNIVFHYRTPAIRSYLWGCRASSTTTWSRRHSIPHVFLGIEDRTCCPMFIYFSSVQLTVHRPYLQPTTLVVSCGPLSRHCNPPTRGTSATSYRVSWHAGNSVLTDLVLAVCVTPLLPTCSRLPFRPWSDANLVLPAKPLLKTWLTTSSTHPRSALAELGSTYGRKGRRSG